MGLLQLHKIKIRCSECGNEIDTEVICSDYDLDDATEELSSGYLCPMCEQMFDTMDNGDGAELTADDFEE